MKKVIIVFGEMGCGKTYWGSRFAKGRDYKFFEGDSVLTQNMIEKITHFKPIPRATLEEYMNILFNTILDRANQLNDGETLMVAQAFYRDQDRKNIKTLLESYGFQVEMWYLRTKLWRNLQNLLTRKDGWKWVYYWLINKPFFQKPTHKYGVALNVYEK